MITISHILILADIHGNNYAVSKLISIINKEKWSIDLILIAGDLPETTPIGLMLHYILSHANLSKTKYTEWVYKGSGRNLFISRQIKSVETILNLLSSLEVPIVYVPGNVDSNEAQQVIKTWKTSEVYFLNAEAVKLGSILIWGYGGSEFTPKRYSEPLCDMEFFPKDFSFQMKPLFSIHGESMSSAFNILLTHEPPAFSCKTAREPIIGGSSEVTKLIKYLKPDLVVFGHYHEFPLIKKQNNIIFINPGPLTRYHFALVDIKEDLVRISIKRMNPIVWDFKNIIYSNRFSYENSSINFTQF